METLKELAPKVRPGSKNVCKKNCKECKALQDVSKLLRLVGEKSAQLVPIAVHFLEANGHDKSEAWRFSAALNLAYAASL